MMDSPMGLNMQTAKAVVPRQTISERVELLEKGVDERHRNYLQEIERLAQRVQQLEQKVG